MRCYKAAFVVTAWIFSITAQAAVMHVLATDGQMLGADNVDVEGVAYDVRFQSGSFNDVFGIIAPVPEYTIEDDAIPFSTALSEQVFVGQYDNDPSLTAGCDSQEYCRIRMPTALLNNVLVVSSGFNNHSDETKDLVLQRNWVDFDSVNSPYLVGTVWAVWTESNTTAVPIPASLPLFLTGLAVLAGIRRTAVK